VNYELITSELKVNQKLIDNELGSDCKLTMSEFTINYKWTKT
jgi:hypothetical protein